ncbi:MAG: histidine phosphatase family protein [Actinomycetota bacterium]
MALRRAWLLRHGSTDFSEQGKFLGWTDQPLSPAGRAEAAALKEIVSRLSPDRVWSSDLVRAVETARLAATEPTVDPRLRELDFGDLEGLRWGELTPSLQKALVRFEGFEAPGGESVEELRERVHGFTEELGPGRHLLVTHGGVIRLMLRELGDTRTVGPGEIVELAPVGEARRTPR